MEKITKVEFEMVDWEIYNLEVRNTQESTTDKWIEITYSNLKGFYKGRKWIYNPSIKTVWTNNFLVLSKQERTKKSNWEYWYKTTEFKTIWKDSINTVLTNLVESGSDYTWVDEL